eukprot:jgi/Mesvir1/18348/Mv14246-RA.1
MATTCARHVGRLPASNFASNGMVTVHARQCSRTPSSSGERRGLVSRLIRHEGSNLVLERFSTQHITRNKASRRFSTSALYVDEDDIVQTNAPSRERVLSKRKTKRTPDDVFQGPDPERLPTSPLRFVAVAQNFPHPEKVAKGGEDAWAISNYRGGVLVVADGVSGAAEDGVCPGLYARELVRHAVEAAEAGEADGDPRRLLYLAKKRTTEEGAATMCVITLGPQGQLRAGNLGDSGFRVLRSGRLAYVSKSLQHSFNCPLQFTSDKYSDFACDAEDITEALKEGDIIVLASDGVWDNMFDADIAELVMQELFRYEGRTKYTQTEAQQTAQRLADAIAEQASRNSLNPKYPSPYSLDAAAHGESDLSLWDKLTGKQATGMWSMSVSPPCHGSLSYKHLAMAPFTINTLPWLPLL